MISIKINLNINFLVRSTKIKTLIFIMVFFLPVNFLTGCVLNDFTTGIDSSRPQSWPKANYNETKICPNISGTYKNIGEYLENRRPTEQEKNLWHRLTGAMEKVSNDEKIKIHPIKNNKLTVDFLSGETLINSKSLDLLAGDFECKEDRFWMRSKIKSGADGTGGYRHNVNFKLEKANDGSLVGEEHLSGVGAVFWIIPLVGTQSTWYRWMPVK